MRGAVLYEANTPLQIEEVTLDGPKDDEVLVQVTATGACHSDYHVMDGSWNGRGYPLPMILGHEAAGIVEKVGTNVRTTRPGDHVILSFSPFCGRCARCTSGSPHLCSEPSALNAQRFRQTWRRNAVNSLPSISPEAIGNGRWWIAPRPLT